MIKEIGFTVYAVSDIKRSRAFYEDILGLKPGKDFPASDDASWIEYLAGGAAFAIGCSPDWKPSENGAVIAFEVDDFDGFVKMLKEKKATFTLEPQDFPTCRMAVVLDPDKSRVLIHQRKAK